MHVYVSTTVLANDMQILRFSSYRDSDTRTFIESVYFMIPCIFLKCYILFYYNFMYFKLYILM